MITIWKVGSPHTGSVPDGSPPPNLASVADRLGAKLRVRALSAREFVDSVFLTSVSKVDQPDILAIDNYGLINGITTPLGTFPPLDATVRDRLANVTESLMEIEGPQPARRNGWEFLVAGSPGNKAARALALRSPSCNPAWRTKPLTQELNSLVPSTAAYFMRVQPAI